MDFGAIGSSLASNLVNFGESLISSNEQQHRLSDEIGQQQNFNAQQAADTRGFQEQMRATQYQTAVADMRAAGLNPALAYQQGGAGNLAGATASSGAAAVGQAPSGGHVDPATASQISVLGAQRDRLEAEKSNLEQQTKESAARTLTYPVSIEQMRSQIGLTRERVQEVIANVGRLKQETLTSAASASKFGQEVENLRAVLPQIEASVQLMRAQKGATAAQMQVSEAEAEQIRQRISADLPAAEESLLRLKAAHSRLELPRAAQDAEAQNNLMAAIMAHLRVISSVLPFTSQIGR